MRRWWSCCGVEIEKEAIVGCMRNTHHYASPVDPAVAIDELQQKVDTLYTELLSRYFLRARCGR
jgi:hypothetical protein